MILNEQNLKFQTLTEHFGNIQRNIITNKITNDNHFSPFSLNMIVRKENQEKMLENQGLLGLIYNYLPMQHYFIGSIAAFVLIVSLIMLGCCIKYKEFVADVFCTLFGWCGVCVVCCKDKVTTDGTLAESEELVPMANVSSAPESVENRPAQRYVNTSLKPPPY